MFTGLEEDPLFLGGDISLDPGDGGGSENVPQHFFSAEEQAIIFVSYFFALALFIDE